MRNPLVTDWLTQPDGLASRLRALRMQANLSGKDLAAAVGWQAPKVSLLENGKQMPKPSDLEAWADACNADPQVAQELLDLLQEAHTVKLDWKRRMRHGQVSVQDSYSKLIEESRLIRYFQVALVPSLLQVPEYARRVLTEATVVLSLEIDDVDAAVAARLQRQQLLYDATKSFEFLLVEPVLRWLVCPVEVMHAQLDRLQTIIDMPNVRFGIIPFAAQLRTTPHNSFQIYDDLVIVETFAGEITYDTPKELETYAHTMDLLWDEAVTGNQARQLIIQAATDLPDTN